MATKKKDDFLMFKGKPLVRNGNQIYYGNMGDEYVVLLQIMGTRKLKDIELADRVLVQLIKTDPDLGPFERIVKKTEKRGLYSALDIGSVWLERELEK